MKKASIGFAGVIAAAVLGFLLYRAADRYVYENGLNVDLKLVAVVALAVVLAVVGTIVAISRRKRRG